MSRLLSDLFCNIIFTTVSIIIYRFNHTVGFGLLAWTVGISYYQLKAHSEREAKHD